jgi:hypothetical protein
MKDLEEDIWASAKPLSASDSGTVGYTRGTTLRGGANNATLAQDAEVPDPGAEA